MRSSRRYPKNIVPLYRRQKPTLMSGASTIMLPGFLGKFSRWRLRRCRANIDADSKFMWQRVKAIAREKARRPKPTGPVKKVPTVPHYPGPEKKRRIGGWVQTFVVVLVALAALIGPKAGIDAYFSWRWQERLAEIRAPYEFERRETLFKLCASFLEWETKYGDHPSMEHMDLICIPDIPVRQPMLVKNVVLKKQDRLRPE